MAFKMNYSKGGFPFKQDDGYSNDPPVIYDELGPEGKKLWNELRNNPGEHMLSKNTGKTTKLIPKSRYTGRKPQSQMTQEELDALAYGESGGPQSITGSGGSAHIEHKIGMIKKKK